MIVAGEQLLNLSKPHAVEATGDMAPQVLRKEAGAEPQEGGAAKVPTYKAAIEGSCISTTCTKVFWFCPDKLGRGSDWQGR